MEKLQALISLSSHLECSLCMDHGQVGEHCDVSRGHAIIQPQLIGHGQCSECPENGEWRGNHRFHSQGISWVNVFKMDEVQNVMLSVIIHT